MNSFFVGLDVTSTLIVLLLSEQFGKVPWWLVRYLRLNWVEIPLFFIVSIGGRLLNIVLELGMWMEGVERRGVGLRESDLNFGSGEVLSLLVFVEDVVEVAGDHEVIVELLLLDVADAE